jgi:hypothetical protein
MLCASGLRIYMKTRHERASRNGNGRDRAGRDGYASFTALVAINVLMYGSSKSPPEMSS